MISRFVVRSDGAASLRSMCTGTPVVERPRARSEGHFPSWPCCRPRSVDSHPSGGRNRVQVRPGPGATGSLSSGGPLSARPPGLRALPVPRRGGCPPRSRNSASDVDQDDRQDDDHRLAPRRRSPGAWRRRTPAPRRPSPIATSVRAATVGQLRRVDRGPAPDEAGLGLRQGDVGVGHDHAGARPPRRSAPPPSGIGGVRLVERVVDPLPPGSR